MGGGSGSATRNIAKNVLLRKRAVIALSGGVDSSVAAYLLLQRKQQQQQQGMWDDVIGVHMSNWDSQDEDNNRITCEQQQQDWKDAQSVAQHLNIPIHPTSFVGEYWTQVFEPFYNEIGNASSSSSSGSSSSMRMPNPDILCNQYIKFGVLKDYCKEQFQADFLATGHYARLWNRSTSTSTVDDNGNNHHMSPPLPLCVDQMLQEDPSLDWLCTWGDKNYNESSSSNTTNPTALLLSPLLLAALDRNKDQSYFLSSVAAEAFHNVIFPLGDIMKSSNINNNNNQNNNNDFCTQMQTQTVREIAQSIQLPNATKRESMGICFIGKRKNGFQSFMNQYIEQQPQKQHQTIATTTDQQCISSSLSYKFIDVDTGAIVGNTASSTKEQQQLPLYTIGQGAKIGGANQKWFVVRVDHDSRSIYVCPGTHHPSLYSDTLIIQSKNLNWITNHSMPPTPLLLSKKSYNISNTTTTTTSMRAKCRIRHLQPLMDCTIIYHNHHQNQGHDYYEIQFDNPVRAITPLQQAVFYIGATDSLSSSSKDDDNDDIQGLVCLGGGPIWKAGPTYMERNIPLSMNQLQPSGLNDLSTTKNI